MAGVAKLSLSCASLTTLNSATVLFVQKPATSAGAPGAGDQPRGFAEENKPDVGDNAKGINAIFMQFGDFPRYPERQNQPRQFVWLIR